MFKAGEVDLNQSINKPLLKAGGIGLEINLNSEEKLPEINLKQQPR